MTYFKFDGETHEMIGQFQYIQEENGEMICRTLCSNGCCDKQWKIKEGDTVVGFRVALTGNLKRLHIIAKNFLFYKSATLTDCKLSSKTS